MPSGQFNTVVISVSDILPLDKGHYISVKGFSSFSFVKKDGKEFHNEIKTDYIFKLLQTVELITLKDNIITSNQAKAQSLMFTYSKKAENQERNKLLCRKFRYRGPVL